MNNEDSIDGTEVLLRTKLISSFTTSCPAVVYDPCVDAIGSIDDYEKVEEYGHYRNTLGPSCSGKIYLTTDDGKENEELVIDYAEHTEFYMITVGKELTANILALVEFTEEIDHCESKIYKGTKITLSEGQHADLLSRFIDSGE